MGLHRWIVMLAARLVPKPSRSDWRAEWGADSTTARPGCASGRGLVNGCSGIRSGERWRHLGRAVAAIQPVVFTAPFPTALAVGLAAVLSLSTAFAAVVIGAAAYNALLRGPRVSGSESSSLFTSGGRHQNRLGRRRLTSSVIIRDHARAFSDVRRVPLLDRDCRPDQQCSEPEHVLVTQVSHNYFSVLGLSGALGWVSLGNSPSDDWPDVVMSRRLWTKLGASQGLIARRFVLASTRRSWWWAWRRQRLTGMTLIWDPYVWMSFKTAEKVLSSDRACSRIVTATMAAHDRPTSARHQSDPGGCRRDAALRRRESRPSGYRRRACGAGDGHQRDAAR